MSLVKRTPIGPSRDIRASGSTPHWGMNLWLALVFGLVFATFSFDKGFIAGTGPGWDRPFGDASTAQIGWFYYAQDEWRWPVFSTATHNVPEGAGIFFSDAIPLFALPAKVAYKFFWPEGSPPFIYMGLWVWLCFVLQAIAASRLLAALAITDPVRQLAGMILFCFAPFFLLRFAHLSLLCHFFILASLDAYARGKRYGLKTREWTFACLLPAIALLTQPYVAAMVLALVVALVLDQWRDRRIGVSGAAIRFGAIASSCVLVILSAGMLSVASANYGDYGTYSMNLLSPWVPFGQTLSGQWLGVSGTTPSIPGGHQWEGGAWMGAGAMLLLLASVPALGNMGAAAKRHAPLILVLVGVFLFAVSNRIGLGSREFVIPLPEKIITFFSTLRTSGRFSWILVYALMAAAVAIVVHRYRPVVSTTLLAATAILQFADTWPLQTDVRNRSATASTHSTDETAWNALISEHSRLFQLPSFACGGLFGGDVPGTIFRELEINWIAARLNKPANSAYISRPNKDCDRENKQALASWREPGTLYLYRDNAHFRHFLATGGVDLTRCGRLDDVIVCSGDRDLSGLGASPQDSTTTTEQIFRWPGTEPEHD